ncbi:EAL domain-containing response regulator [Ectothiorhodospira lacustris]|uniref:EAL domain-containing response regulator n=1 Tax=Ectothiorhodospira lacustris TaxID=2899127 RepID=UPI001EE93746|nr:EAL domain-containing protein [Ectothiorhodospira lacustris]MCG5500426.1 EAL domain-containing protein [Ectothiorhodospira lacustris]MCG5509985.1 EAL domain-containing protein [Ectothiorhodospira lacustris]MCG5521731.1 EAL domain-containing protein [Ectothiorhodospira lacustris]
MDNLLRLLIIDDDLNDAEMMVSTLKSAGLAVRPERAEDEEDLLTKLKHHTPDVIICALGHPSLSLDKVIQSSRQMGRHAPVVAVATSSDTDIVECLELGAHDMVRKNHMDHLRLVITRALAFQQQWRSLKVLESSLRETERRCKMLLDNARDAIAYVHEGMHLYANPAYLELFGFADIEEIEGIPIMDMVVREEQQKLKECLRQYDDTQNADAHPDSPPQPQELQLKRISGENFSAPMEFSSAIIDGEPCIQILIRSNAGGNTLELEKKLNYLSQRDLITGLYNRQYFLECVQQALGQATQSKANATLIELTVDQFSGIRELVGVAGADLVLSDLGKLLEEACGQSDIVARLEGQAYGILCQHWEMQEILQFTRDLLSRISEHICEVEGRSISFTASIGAAQVDENAPDIDELLSRSHKACEEAATSGGNRTVIYQPKEGEMTQKQLDETWSRRITEAMDSNRLVLLFQPIISLHGEAGERYEVFMRLLNKGGEAISPSQFMPSAERTDLARQLDQWVIGQALSTLAARRKAGYDTVFFIKITGGTLHDPGMVPWIADRLKEHRIPAECAVFQIKVATVVAHLKQARELVKSLKSIHCQFVLDDFGVGLNPFQILQHIPVDYLKVDGSYTRNLAKSIEDQEVLKHLTDTAHSQGKMIIAQQVEEAATLSILWGLGVNFIQGNFLQAPSGALEYDFSSMG